MQASFDPSPSTMKEVCWKCKGNGSKYNKASKKFDGKKCGVCRGTGARTASVKAQTLAKQTGEIKILRGCPNGGSVVGPLSHGSLRPEKNDAKGNPLPSLVNKGEILGSLGCGNWRIYQLAAGHKLTVDDFICAWVACTEMRALGFGGVGTFGTRKAPPTGGSSAPPQSFTHADIGCGCGSVLMTLAWAFPQAIVSRGVEAQAVSFDLLQRGLAWNTGVDGSDDREDATLRVEHIDLRKWDGGAIGSTGGGYDLITGTPPYFPQKQFVSSQNHSQKIRCRVPTRGAACDYVKAAARLLSPSGIFVMVETSRKEAEHAVLEAVHGCNLQVVKRLDVIPRKGLPSRFSCWVISKKQSRSSESGSYPISQLLLRLDVDENYKRSNEYVDAMTSMGWINFEKFKALRKIEDAAEEKRKSAALLVGRRGLGVLLGSMLCVSVLRSFF